MKPIKLYLNVTSLASVLIMIHYIFSLSQGIDNAGGDTTVVYGVDPVSSRTSFAQQTSEFMMDNEGKYRLNPLYIGE